MKIKLTILSLLISLTLAAQQVVILDNKDTMIINSGTTKIPVTRDSIVRVTTYIDVPGQSVVIKKYVPPVTTPPPANIAPVARAGNDQTIQLPSSSTNLSGTASSDADGTISSYLWQQVSGPSSATMELITTSNVLISNLRAGVYVFRLTVTDNRGATANDDVRVTVQAAANQPPVANAGADKAITLPTSSTTLNGSGTDSDGNVASYLWAQVSGPSTSVFSVKNLANVTVSSLVAGTYTYRLTVTDNAGATATDQVSVTVNPAPTTPNPGNTITFAVPVIPASEYLNRPGAGAETWHNGSDARAGLPQPLDVYHRFVWTRLEGATQGSYNWTYFDNLVNQAISRGQKMSFGIMTEYSDGNSGVGLANYDGAYSSYPKYVHDQMQKEAVKDWISPLSGTWVPNYNSQFYLDRLLALHKALNQHIIDKGWHKVIQFIDVRGFGSWGEWNSSGIVTNVNQYPAGTFPTVATFKKIIDAHTQGFPDFPLVAMIAAFDAGWLNNTMIPAEVGYYILTTKNNWGPLGWRRDQWGATDQYLKDYLENNNRSFNGVQLKTLIMERWKTSPITGEPMPSGNNMTDLVRQIKLYHATSFGEGNYGDVSGSTLVNNIKEAANAAGYRIQVKDGSITTGTNGSIKVTWENVGQGPTYENWNTVFELKSGSTVVWTGNSSFKAKLFLPGSITVTDNFPNIPSGNYVLTVKLVDPAGYRAPLPLANRGRNTDGSYTLKP